MTEYTLYVAHSGTNLSFKKFDEFEYYLSRYFAPYEFDVVEKLTTFKMRTIKAENGYTYKYGENNYKDIKTCCYVYDG